MSMLHGNRRRIRRPANTDTGMRHFQRHRDKQTPTRVYKKCLSNNPVSKRLSLPSMASSLFALSLLFLSLHVSAKVVLEDGYTVTTVLSGHKQFINPRSVLPKPGSSDLIILDSVNSIFYTVQFPISNESVVKRFSGDGSSGYSDGDVGSARFRNPRSFAVDLKGNVYVADRMNHVIRKISSTGVTTIAGGYIQKKGSKDGPAQNASFSEDFELTFIPGACALLVSDHVNQLIRQINLKEEDCTFRSNSGLGAFLTWTLGLGLSCLLGLIIGIAVRPYIIPHEGTSPCHSPQTWKHCLIHLVNQALILFFGSKSVVASSVSIHTLLRRLWTLILSHVLLMFSICNPRPHQETVSLIDLDACSSGEVRKSSKYDDQLKDLISFDEGLSSDATNKAVNQGYDNWERSAMFSGCHGIDKRVQANLSFPGVPKDKNLLQGSSECNVGLVKRR